MVAFKKYAAGINGIGDQKKNEKQEKESCQGQEIVRPLFAQQDFDPPILAIKVVERKR